MAQHMDNVFSRFLEFVILGITVGCTFWITLLAYGMGPAFARGG